MSPNHAPLVIRIGAFARLPPIEKLEPAGTAAVDRSADQNLQQGQGILRKAVHLVALLQPLHGFRPAADTARVAGKQEPAMSIESAMIRTVPVFALRALIHVGPQQFFEYRSMHTHQTLSAAGAGQHSHLKL